MSLYKYNVKFEIVGRFAHFNDSMSGAANISLPFPSPSACRGILNSIYNIQDASIKVRKIGIVSLNSRSYFVTNSKSHLRKACQIAKNDPMQRKIEVLNDVHFFIDVAIGFEYDKIMFKSDFVKNTKDPAHALAAILNRRIKEKQFERTPCLGVREFLIDDIFLSEECPETKNINGEWQVVKQMFPTNRRRNADASPVWTTAFVNQGIVTFRE